MELLFPAVDEPGIGTFETFPSGGGKAAIRPNPDIR